MFPRLSYSYLALALSAASLLSGCGNTAPQTSAVAPAAPVAPNPPTTGSDSDIQGNVHGGQQPVVGAHVHLFAANSAGYGTPSISLLNPAIPGVYSDTLGGYVLTDPLGNFSYGGDYACTPGQQVYVLVTQGNPGTLPTGTSNPALSLMAVVGACPAGQTNFANSGHFVYINELTTVACAYALSGFLTDGTHLSSSATPVALQGLANAMLNVFNLVDINSGAALTQTPASGGDTPLTALNTLADILVACVNSDGTSACSNLFTNAPGPSNTPPTNTVDAIINIAHNPGVNVPQLYANGYSNLAYQPSLTTVPNDWTLAFTFYANNMVGPYFPAIDSIGNIWVPDYANNTLTEFSPTGAILSGNSGFSGGGLNLPFAIAIDNQDSPWITNFGPINASTVSKFKIDGTPATTTPYTCSTACFFLAFDAQQNLWISGSDRATVLTPAGNALNRYPTAAYTSGISINSTGIGWTIGQPRTLYRLGLPSTLSSTTENVTASSGNELTPNAIDSNDNIWYVSNQNNSLGESDKNGVQLAPVNNGFTGGGLKGPAQIAIDGSNRVWAANRDGSTLSAFTNAGAPISPPTGFQAPGLANPRGLAIDASGNVWLTNFTYNSITEFIGVATPVVTPISPTTHGQRP